jgi:hypothetical protein
VLRSFLELTNCVLIFALLVCIMLFMDMENPDSLPLSEPALGVDILVTQRLCEEDVPLLDAIQARYWKVETEKER